MTRTREMPPVGGVTLYNPAKVQKGYTLFSPLEMKKVWLIDMRGRFAHHWEMPYVPGLHGEFLPNGNLLYAGRDPKSPLAQLFGCGGVLMEVDWDGNLVWKYEDPYLHHTFCRMANGNTMVLKWVEVPKDMAAKVKGGIPGTELDGVMWTDSFQEITPSGKVIWEWKAYEHLDPEKDVFCPLCARNEWTSANALKVLPNGDILTSFRRTNTVAIIDKQSGNIKWKWGYGIVAHQHDPTLLENGNILLFDNGFHPYGLTQGISQVLEVNPDTSEIVWSYRDDPTGDIYCPKMGSCQRLDYANTMICLGDWGRIFEIKKNGEVIWDYESPFFYDHPVLGYTNMVFSARRYGYDYEGFQGKQMESLNSL